MTNFDESKINRRSAGTSGGGQFAAKSNSRPGSSLAFETAAFRSELDAERAGTSDLARKWSAMSDDSRQISIAGAKLSREQQELAAADENPRTRSILLDNKDTAPDIRAALENDDDRMVRITAAASMYTSQDTLRRYADSDPDERVRDIAGRMVKPAPAPTATGGFDAAQSATQRSLILRRASEEELSGYAEHSKLSLTEQADISKSRSQKVRIALAKNDTLDHSLQTKLAKDRAKAVRLSMVSRADLDPDALDVLKKDKDASIRSLAENWSPRR